MFILSVVTIMVAVAVMLGGVASVQSGKNSAGGFLTVCMLFIPSILLGILTLVRG